MSFKGKSNEFSFICMFNPSLRDTQILKKNTDFCQQKLMPATQLSRNTNYLKPVSSNL